MNLQVPVIFVSSCWLRLPFAKAVSVVVNRLAATDAGGAGRAWSVVPQATIPFARPLTVVFPATKLGLVVLIFAALQPVYVWFGDEPTSVGTVAINLITTEVGTSGVKR